MNRTRNGIHSTCVREICSTTDLGILDYPKESNRVRGLPDDHAGSGNTSNGYAWILCKLIHAEIPH